ncbi:LysR family transcriptional regulator [Sphingobium boeckii]|uniref:DNA-binding transcriptional LysR family regulator n=1 Tax=Sphingobium boeckii TaxID=1082345 RepID=A0A7W9AIE5_9SPHN|nr:LysR family transcriptional regulator [Sphingobium boeckii]MBB5686257.1 DNA-binding transcriptional LysR family regulator [Sphingobium boeckii]
MNIVKLERMVAVYESRSVSKAALGLGMSQPALTLSIQQLEDELKVRLFDRGPGGLEPTAMCEKLVSRARLIISEQDRLLADVRDQGLNQVITFGVHSGMLHDGFARCVAEFSHVVPDATLCIEAGYSPELIDLLRQGKLDFAYCTLPLGASDDKTLFFEPRMLLNYSVVVQSDHPIFEDMAKGQRKRYPWVIFQPRGQPDGFPTTDNIEEVLVQTGFGQASQEVRTSSMSVIELLVLRGRHIGVIADDIVAPELAAGRLKRLPHSPWNAVQMGFVSIQGKYETSAVAKLKTLLRDMEPVVTR